MLFCAFPTLALGEELHGHERPRLQRRRHHVVEVALDVVRHCEDSRCSSRAMAFRAVPPPAGARNAVHTGLCTRRAPPDFYKGH
jgi:hypothetical protein